MVSVSKGMGAVVLRLIVGLALLGCARMGSAQGTWSIVSLPHNPIDVFSPMALAVDTAGEIYVLDAVNLDGGNGFGIKKHDAQGNWSGIATRGAALGQVIGLPTLAVDRAGNLYVADGGNDGSGRYGRIQRRDAQGQWTIIATSGGDLGQVSDQSGLAVDPAGNLYVADRGHHRIQRRDAQGNWFVVAAGGHAPGQVYSPSALTMDGAGNLYVADRGRIQQRDARGHWSVIATAGSGLGQVHDTLALAADAAGNLYVGEGDTLYSSPSRIQKRDINGHWSVIATYGSASGQVGDVHGLAVDVAGNLYIADARPDVYSYSGWGGRIQERDVQGSWSVVPTAATALGQVYHPLAVAVDGTGHLYVADRGNFHRIQTLDAQGTWSVTAAFAFYDISNGLAAALAADPAGNLYVSTAYLGIYKRDARGNWSPIVSWLSGYLYGLAADAAGNLYFASGASTDFGDSFGIYKIDAQGSGSLIANFSGALAVDTAGNLYVASGEIQKRDAQGKWSVVATSGTAVGQVSSPTALAADAAGNLYVADYGNGDGRIQNRIQRRDTRGNWSVIATSGTAVGQVDGASGLAVDVAGNLYVADTGNDRVQKYTPRP